ncbi:MAG: hypothetical protein LUG19_04200 [Desulfovibrio sp.]|uniref:hypothetical protein n=1 Tax=Desulfovibrio sp. TaxID=885 RepID=UPI0025843650|nr:hypothetical protein [Desulfovibrio sp.]MCD7983442.1 hypothetical protein [Desulfovibrio sp.]
MQNTGNLNSLAERMKAKAEQEQQELEALTRQQFNALQQSLSELSKNALNITEAAIQRQLTSLEQSVTTRCRILSAAFGWKCLQALSLTLCIMLGAGLSGWGLLALAEKKVTTLHREIITLSERKDSLEAQSARIWATFKGLEPYQSEGKDYLLTPEGWTITHGGTLNGKQDAWRIVRK